MYNYTRKAVRSLTDSA